MQARNPRWEAKERIGGEAEARVLEPSPPTATTPPWFADDPAAPGDVPPGRIVVGPTTAADVTWDTRCAADPELAAWCADRWLGAWRRLPPPPGTLTETRIAMHTLAEHVIAPARHAANGRIGLRWTLRGFGTPYYLAGGHDRQLRVDGDQLARVDGAIEERVPISTLAEAGDFAGITFGPTGVYAPTNPLDPDLRLNVDGEAVAFLSDWFGSVVSVLEQLRAETRPDEAASRCQLWPEHFDLAFEAGDEGQGRRAGFGGSPGDEHIDEPYLYVVPWADPPGDGWNATTFRGAVLRLSGIQDPADQRELVLAFFRDRRDLLRGDV